MAKKNGSTFTSEDLQSQDTYVEKLEQQHFSYPLIAAESFVRGMRESGYKSTATALNELIDNAIQAQARNVDVILGYNAGNKTKKKPDMLAVVDDGHGMREKMIKASVMWGGTHRENDRHGFGRFGFGLPSASVSIARRFSVYSKAPGDKWFVIVIDLDEIALGRATDEKGVVKVPEAVLAELPEFVKPYASGLEHGTVILLEKLDRLSNGFVTSQAFKQNELHQVGVTYREILRDVQVRVIDIGEELDITAVEPIDPLFLRPDARYYDETDVHAEPLPDLAFEVKPSEESPYGGVVRVRYAYMPPGFLPDESKRSSPRLKVRKENTGLIIMRAGRQIDVVTNGPKFSVDSNDRHWACEVIFEPTLDEDFSVTTNKQQIVIKDRIWEALRQNGVFDAIRQMRNRYGKDHGYTKGKKAESEPKVSEEIATEAAKFFGRKPTKPSVAKEKKLKEALDREAVKVAEQKGTSPEEAKKVIEAETAEKPYKLFFESGRGEFYRVEQLGGQKQLYINTSHRFYSDVYNNPLTTNRMRTALELLLFTMGACELESEGDREMFYTNERVEWTRRLDTYLQLLDRRDPVADARAAETTRAEAEDESAA